MSVNGKCSIQFIDNCTSTHVNPRFLKFRIPNNDCFELTTLHYLSNKVTEKGTVQNKSCKRKSKSQDYMIKKSGDFMEEISLGLVSIGTAVVKTF